MITIRLKSIIFLLFFFHLIPACANCEFCKNKRCECNSLFQEIISNLKHEKQTPESAQPPQPRQGLGSGLGSGLGLGSSSGLGLSNGGLFGQPSTLKQGSQLFSNSLFNTGTNKVQLCQALSAVQISGQIQLCCDTLMFAQEFITMLELMSSGDNQPEESSTDWLSSFSRAFAYSFATSTTTNAWVSLENGSWLFIVIMSNSNLAVLEWGQGSGAAYSVNRFSSREQALIFLAGKIDQINCLSSGYYKKNQ